MNTSGFERGEQVRVLTDLEPRPHYVVMTTDERTAVVAQVASGFVRRVPLTELMPLFTWDRVPRK